MRSEYGQTAQVTTADIKLIISSITITSIYLMFSIINDL